MGIIARLRFARHATLHSARRSLWGIRPESCHTLGSCNNDEASGLSMKEAEKRLVWIPHCESWVSI